MSIVIFKDIPFDTKKIVKVTMIDGSKKIYYGKFKECTNDKKININSNIKGNDIDVPAYKAEGYEFSIYENDVIVDSTKITEKTANVEYFEE